MTGLEWALAGVGFTVTALVLFGMVLLTPRGTELDRDDTRTGQGAELSRADVPRGTQAGR